MLMSFISAYGENISHLSTNILKPSSIYDQNGDSNYELETANTNNTTQCAENQTPQNGFCLNNNGACLLPKQGSMQQGYYNEGACSPCGYYNKNGGSVNQQCCKTNQDAYMTQDSSFPVVCFDKNAYTCYQAKDPNNPDQQQNTYEAQGSANTICSKAWLCQKKSENNVADNNCPSCPRDTEATITNENGLVALSLIHI